MTAILPPSSQGTLEKIFSYSFIYQYIKHKDMVTWSPLPTCSHIVRYKINKIFQRWRMLSLKNSHIVLYLFKTLRHVLDLTIIRTNFVIRSCLKIYVKIEVAYLRWLRPCRQGSVASYVTAPKGRRCLKTRDYRKHDSCSFVD